MATIVTRSGKGSPLTHAEVDSNFTNLNTDKLELSGGTMTGNLSFGDDDKAIFGDGNDLQIYHDGTSNRSYITESNADGNGHFFIQGDNLILENTGGENYFRAVNGGAVQLYYSGSEKLATTSTGVDITGTLTSDGLTVDASTMRLDGGAGEAKFIIDSGTNFDAFIQYKEAGSNNWSVGVDGDDGNKFKFGVGSDLTSNTAVTINPADNSVDITGTLGVTTVDFGDWTITESGGSLYFATGGTNKMKLDASGNLQVVGNVEANATIS
jgi:hypothetical protein